MNDLTELLQKWAALEPDLCSHPGGMLFHVQRAGHWLTMTPTRSPTPENAAAMADRLQGAIQEAIEIREGTWGVEYLRQEGEHLAGVSLNPSIHIQQGGSTPAAALLAAYVQALEMEYGG